MELLPEAEGQPLRFRAVVPVRPAIELADYDGSRGHRRPRGGRPTTKSTAALDRMRREAATLVPVDRPVQLGDIATLDYEGKIDGVAFEGGTAQGQQTEVARRVASSRASSTGIVGMTAGETQGHHGAFPRRLRQSGAGRQGRRLRHHGPRDQGAGAPALDDEFAKRVSRYGVARRAQAGDPPTSRRAR